MDEPLPRPSQRRPIPGVSIHDAVAGDHLDRRRPAVSIPRSLSELLEEHLRTYPSTVGLVFSAPAGGPLRRSLFYRRHFTPVVRSVGLEPFRFHDLRHTAVALAIAHGAHPKAIQERLGHSSIRTTMDRYGHLLPTLDEELQKGLDTALRTPRPIRGLRSRTSHGSTAAKGPKEAVIRSFDWSGRRDSNPRPSPCNEMVPVPRRSFPSTEQPPVGRIRPRGGHAYRSRCRPADPPSTARLCSSRCPITCFAVLLVGCHQTPAWGRCAEMPLCVVIADVSGGVRCRHSVLRARRAEDANATQGTSVLGRVVSGTVAIGGSGENGTSRTRLPASTRALSASRIRTSRRGGPRAPGTAY